MDLLGYCLAPFADIRGIERLDLGSDDSSQNSTGRQGGDHREIPAVSDDPFWTGGIGLRQMIHRQGIKPLSRIEDLKTDFWPADETADQLIAAVRSWRDEER